MPVVFSTFIFIWRFLRQRVLHKDLIVFLSSAGRWDKRRDGEAQADSDEDGSDEPQGGRLKQYQPDADPDQCCAADYPRALHDLPIPFDVFTHPMFIEC